MSANISALLEYAQTNNYVVTKAIFMRLKPEDQRDVLRKLLDNIKNRHNEELCYQLAHTVIDWLTIQEKQ